MNHTVNLNTANIRSLKATFNITSELAKAIDLAKPCSESELISITGFPENFDFDEVLICYWGDKPSETFLEMEHKNMNQEIDNTGGVDTAELYKMLKELRKEQDLQKAQFVKQLHDSNKKIELLQSELGEMSKGVCESCKDITASVAHLHNFVLGREANRSPSGPMDSVLGDTAISPVQESASANGGIPQQASDKGARTGLRSDYYPVKKENSCDGDRTQFNNMATNVDRLIANRGGKPQRRLPMLGSQGVQRPVGIPGPNV